MTENTINMGNSEQDINVAGNDNIVINIHKSSGSAPEVPKSTQSA